MSYEGYERMLCAEGHLWQVDSMAMYSQYEESTMLCPECQGKPVWFNSVDQTNGCGKLDGTSGEVQPDHSDCMCGIVMLEENTPSVICICEGCGNKHVSKGCTYKIPPSKVGR